VGIGPERRSRPSGAVPGRLPCAWGRYTDATGYARSPQQATCRRTGSRRAEAGQVGSCAYIVLLLVVVSPVVLRDSQSRAIPPGCQGIFSVNPRRLRSGFRLGGFPPRRTRVTVTRSVSGSPPDKCVGCRAGFRGAGFARRSGGAARGRVGRERRPPRRARPRPRAGGAPYHETRPYRTKRSVADKVRVSRVVQVDIRSSGSHNPDR